MTVYSPTTVPVTKGAGLSAELNDIAQNSQIDILRLLGRPATKIIINVTTGDSIAMQLNTATRRVVANKAGVVDSDGNISTLPEFGSTTSAGVFTKGADNTCDITTNIWGNGELSITAASNAPANSIWNSSNDYGALPINSITFGTITGSSVITCKFIA